MNQEALEALFQLIPEGMFDEPADLNDVIEKEGLEGLYPLLPEGMFETEEEFVETFGGQKKKDIGVQQPGQTTDVEEVQSTQMEEGEIGSSESPSQSSQNRFDDPERQAQLDNQLDTQIDFQVDQTVDYGGTSRDRDPFDDPRFKPVGTKFGANVEVGEKNTWLEEMFGKNEFTDFFGDIYRAGAQGLKQGATIDDARNMFVSGAGASDEDIQEYIAAVSQMDDVGMSDEMKSFNQIYERNGGGILGFVSGVFQNPTVISQLFVSSVASMVNADVAGGAAAGAGVGAGAGAAIGSTGFAAGPLGIATTGAGAIAGSISGAIMGASATLETGLAFTEFLKEELSKRGLEFNQEGIRAVLANNSALSSIRNKAVARGMVIGTVDAFTRGLAGQIGGKTVKAAKLADKAVDKGMKARAGLKAAGIEAVGGAGGEAAARAVTGQEMDVAEIGFEGITGQASSILSVPQAVSGRSLTDIARQTAGKGINIFKPPKYGVLTKKGVNQPQTKEQIMDMVETMTDQEIIDAQFNIKNDPELQTLINERKQKALYDKETPKTVFGARRKRYLELLAERDNMQDPDNPENKQRLKAIDEELNSIAEESKDALTELVGDQLVGVTRSDALEALKTEGIEKPTDEQVKNKQKELLKLAVEAAKQAAEVFTGQKNIKELEDEAKDQLISEGIVEPTDQQIKERANAIQESSATQVDVQESTGDSQTVGEGDTQGVVTEESQTQDQTPIETQTQEEVSINVAPFYEANIESTSEASGLRKSPQYQQYKNSLTEIANDMGLEVEVEESVGGYVNQESGSKIREISNIVKLKNATLEQASQYAALTSALAPEVQQSSIAAEYTIDGAENHNGNEISIKVSDSEGTFQALQEAGIDEYTLSETNNLLSLIDIFDFSDPEADAKLETLLNILDKKNITYEVADKKAINSRFIDSKSRKQILSDGRQSAIQQQQEGSSLYKKIISAINRDAQNQGISPNEYIGTQTAPEVTADAGRVDAIVDDIVKKTKARKVGKSTSPKVLLNNTLKYLQNSKLYKQLDDVSRNDLVRKLNEKLGIKIKKAPSVKKVLGKPKDKKVVVNERTALKDQIRRQAKAARESAAAYKKAMKNIAAQITGFGKKLGKVSKAKVDAITKRFANVNLNNPKSVDNFLQFVDDVFTKADFFEKVKSSKTFAKRAKKQVGGYKTGVLPQDLKVALETLFSIDPSIIPADKIDTFLELAREYGSGKKVLDLQPPNETLPKILDVLNAVESNLDADMEAVVAEKATKDVDVDAEVTEIMELSNDISNADINNIVDPRAREQARRLRGLSAQDILELAKEKKDGTMDYSDVMLLKQVMKNIKNGFAGKAVTDLNTKLNNIESAKELNPILKPFKRNVYTDAIVNLYSTLKGIKTDRGFLTERIRSLSTFFLDDVLGNKGKKNIYNQTFGKLARSYEVLKTKLTKLQAKVDAADNILEYDGLSKARKLSRTGRSTNDVVKKKYKIRMLQLQREHEANTVDGKSNPKAPSAMDFIDATIEGIKQDQLLSDTDLKILEELKAEFDVDGQISSEKIDSSLTPDERKALALYDEVNNSLAADAQYISSNLHGNKINLLNDYNHHAVLESKKEGESSLTNKLKRFLNTIQTKSGTIVERTNGAKPISFDPSYSAMRGAQETLLDAEMTQVVREVDGTLNLLEQQLKKDGTKESVQAVKAIKKAKKELMTTIFRGSLIDNAHTGFLNNLRIQKLGYQAALASVYRAGSEIAGNLAIMMSNPKLALKAFGRFGKMSFNPKNVTQGIDIMEKLRSSQTSKLFDSDALQSKHSQMTDYGGLNSKKGAGVSRVQNVIGQILKFSGVKQTAAVTDKIASKIITFPDQMMARPLWFASWASAFEAQVKEQTGETVKITPAEYKKIADGTSKFLDKKYEGARNTATAQADAKTVTLATSNNPFDGIIKNMRNVDDGALKAIYRMANSYMARFSLYEFGTARNAINSMFHKGDLSKAEAAALMAGVIGRMSGYMVTYTMLTSLLDDELFDAEDYREEDFEDLLARQTLGAMLSILGRGSMGNIPTAFLNLGIEELNRQQFGDLRDNVEYDPYVHSIVFSIINPDDFKSKSLADIGANMFLGPYGPAFKTLSRIVQLGASATGAKKRETKQKAEEELVNRMTIEVLGNLGLLPFYKDIRRILLKKRFAKNPNILTKAQIEELRRNGELIEDDIIGDDTLEEDGFLPDDDLLID